MDFALSPENERRVIIIKRIKMIVSTNHLIVVIVMLLIIVSAISFALQINCSDPQFVNTLSDIFTETKLLVVSLWGSVT